MTWVPKNRSNDSNNHSNQKKKNDNDDDDDDDDNLSQDSQDSGEIFLCTFTEVLCDVNAIRPDIILISAMHLIELRKELFFNFVLNRPLKCKRFFYFNAYFCRFSVF